jgi:hypothetical protein
MTTFVPDAIEGYEVLEYGFFDKPLLPTGYVSPPDGQKPLEPVQNLAICRAEGVDGFYLLFCTTDWCYVTYSFCETIECVKLCPEEEFGHPVLGWHKRAKPLTGD